MERSPHHSHHSVEDDWPLTLAVNERGQSIHVCADCGTELPDGCCVERDDNGRVLAWMIGGVETDDNRLITGHVRTMVHECEGPNG